MYSPLFLFLALAGLYQAEAQGSGPLRLNNNGNVDPSNTQGVVEVMYNGAWGPICNRQSTGYNVAQVVCHQLGYTTGSLTSSSFNDLPDPVLGELSCASSNYLVVLQCSHHSPSSSCSPPDNIAVVCSLPRIWDVPYTGMVRLQGGSFAGQGRVEVYCNGQWGGVCGDSGFNGNTATTVCTQLGYNGHTSVADTPVVGSTWIANANCASAQSCLSSCATCSVSNVACNNAANVTCSYNTDHNEFGSTRYTCGIDGLTAGAIVGIFIAALIAFICFCALLIGIPLCICCCCGVGIGAAASRPRYSTI